MSSEKCAIHAGRSHQNRDRRRRLDLTIRKLPESSAGKGAKKCAYCAYLLGIEDTIKAVEKALKIGQFPKGADSNKALQNRRYMEDAIGELIVYFEDVYRDHLQNFVDKHFPNMGDDEREQWIDKHETP